MSSDESAPATPTSWERRHPAGSSQNRLVADEVHDLDRVRTAIRELSHADLARLSLIARTLLGGLGIHPEWRDPKDLLSSAIARTLSGERQWSRQVDLSRHLFQTMRSIVSHWRRELLHIHADKAPYYYGPAPPEEPQEPVSPQPDPEASAITRSNIQAICRHFEDDEPAKQVIACMAEGLKGPEIRGRTGMTQRQLTTTLERIRRYARRREYDDV